MGLTDYEIGERIINQIVEGSLFRVVDAEPDADCNHVVVWSGSATTQIGQLVKVIAEELLNQAWQATMSKDPPKGDYMAMAVEQKVEKKGEAPEDVLQKLHGILAKKEVQKLGDYLIEHQRQKVGVEPWVAETAVDIAIRIMEANKQDQEPGKNESDEHIRSNP